MTWLRAWGAWESVLLFAICVGDMASTLYWVHRHVATEANPWMAFCLTHGDWAFCAVKLLSFLPFLALCAWLRPRRPRLSAFSLRLTVTLYVALYVSAVARQAFMG